jgi:hypothetical protein
LYKVFCDTTTVVKLGKGAIDLSVPNHFTYELEGKKDAYYRNNQLKVD